QPALFDLKRMGPHFTVAGPPLSGKTTTLYNWVLSLASRYGPEQVMFVLIDTQQRLFDYGGKQTLRDLPHVLAAVSEIEDLGAVTQKLMAEAQIMANQDTGRTIFIVIDNFDDFSEEVDAKRDLSRDLGALARRYGSKGIHFVIAGTLDGTTNELRRRVMGSNYGVGLRSAQAVETLRVQRTPNALRGKEFPAGRGYIVKSGQPTMIQIATPYTMEAGAAPTGTMTEEEAITRPLDAWVERIRATYAGRHASWTGSNGHATASTALSPQQSQKLRRMVGLLQAGMRKEIKRLKQGEGNGHLLTDQLMQMDISSWNDEQVVLKLLRELWLTEHVNSGMPQPDAEMMLSILDEESVLLGLEDSLAGADAQSSAPAA
ncbi:MAG: hypothetical protein JOZ51_16095, partial [Chloroflexi bacterium]|nr:hypothetical protein [Chloroflexota bacterium]